MFTANLYFNIPVEKLILSFCSVLVVIHTVCIFSFTDSHTHTHTHTYSPHTPLLHPWTCFLEQEAAKIPYDFFPVGQNTTSSPSGQVSWNQCEAGERAPVCSSESEGERERQWSMNGSSGAAEIITLLVLTQYCKNLTLVRKINKPDTV